MRNGSELSNRPQSRREWHGVWRSLVLPLVLVAAIVGALWYLDAGGALPFVGKIKNGTSRDLGSEAFLSLQSQGIKLGAAGGPAANTGQPAPDFALLDLQGRLVRLSDFEGKTVVLNFWATWCIPCRIEFPKLIAAYERNKDAGLVVIGVDVEENPGIVRKFITDFGAPYPIVIDSTGGVSSQYRIAGLPITWFIDGQGVARAQVVGQLTDELIRSSLKDAGFTVKP